MIEWSGGNPYRPFCSERCKLIDLGAWFTEQRGIPGDAPPLDEDPSPESGEEPQSPKE